MTWGDIRCDRDPAQRDLLAVCDYQVFPGLELCGGVVFRHDIPVRSRHSDTCIRIFFLNTFGAPVSIIMGMSDEHVLDIVRIDTEEQKVHHQLVALNVGRAYAAFAADIAQGTRSVPDFDDAVRRHQVLAAIERSAASGERVKP